MNILEFLYDKGVPPSILNLITPSYYIYLFSDLNWTDNAIHKVKVILCRIKGHPYGVVWYSSGFEPDMTCTNCGEDLG